MTDEEMQQRLRVWRQGRRRRRRRRRPDLAMIAALRRLVIAFVALFAVTFVVSLAAGWLFGSSVPRSLSLGFDMIGIFFLVIGFFVGMRGPFRMAGGRHSRRAETGSSAGAARRGQ